MEKFLRGLLLLSLLLEAPAMAIVGGTTVEGPLPHYMSESDRTEMISHTVALIDMHTPGAYDVCSSTLIARDILITAAHCVRGDIRNLHAVFSDRTFAVYDRVGIRKVIHHPKYTDSSGLPYKNDPNYDIAVVLLDAPAPMFYKPAPMLSSYVSKHNRFWAYVAGYGDTSYKAGDQGRLRFARITFSDYAEQSTRSYLEGEEQKVEGTCNGDSGGPVFVKFNNQFHLLGLTSIEMTIPDNCRGVTFFSYIPYYKSWIDQAIKDLRK